MRLLNVLPLMGTVLAIPSHDHDHHVHSQHNHWNDPDCEDFCNYDLPGAKYFYLSNVTYQSHVIYSTPAHLAVSYAQLDFNLTNNVAYNAKCSGTSSGYTSGSWFAWPQNMTCVEEDNGNGMGVTGNATWIYLGYDKSLQVNETWECGGHHYLGTANLTLDLNCETKSWTNPNYTWPTGEFYHTEDVTCDPIDVPVVPTFTKLD